MPIDPSIALQARPVEAPDLVGAYTKMLSLRHLIDQGKVSEQSLRGLTLENQQRERAIKDEDDWRRLYGGGATPEQRMQTSPAREMAFRKSQADQLKAESERQLKAIELAGAKQAQGAQIIGSLYGLSEPDRASQWMPAMQKLVKNGYDPKDLPQQYDPVWFARTLHEGMAAEKQIDDHRKEVEHKLTVATKESDLLQKQLESAGQTVGANANQNDYTAWRDALPKEVRAKIPPMYSPAAVAMVKRMGMTPAQQSAADHRENMEKRPASEADLIFRATGGDPARAAAQMQNNRLAVKQAGRSGGAGGGNAHSALIDSVMANPLIFDSLTPTAKTAISAELQKRGFAGFGKQLSESAITKMAESKSAVQSLTDLRTVLKENEGYLGPVAGLLSNLPWETKAGSAKARVNLVRQRVGKALEGGVLRKEDEEKYKEILATMYDKPELAYSKIDGLIQTLQSDLGIFEKQQRLAGRKVETPPQPERNATTGNVIVWERGPDGKPRRKQ